jgi:two-component system cell cycle sensor histidine kinase/response regulator CckA
VSGMLKMLSRLIGEDIDLAWMPGHNLWQIKMDPSQIDQILANLAVNARDAIAGVGKVTIETHNITFDETYCTEHSGFSPGQYVILAVSDDGVGMGKGILEHLFEPFFTTKELGKGTGLGLATVYGIVKQNNGFIDVYSEPGEGTTFKIYLPRIKTEGGRTGAEGEPETLQRGNETVLMVEDETAILKIGKAMLEFLGYEVLAANSPREAIRLAEEHPGAIHLLLTDVVMPEMNGRELAEHLKRSHPDLICLFMSGYTANAIAHHGVLDEGMNFMHKPFSLKDLAAKVCEALDKA